MTTTCKRWVLPASRSFTGGCSMRMLSDSSESECSICVIPVDVAGPNPGTVVDPSCKQWEISKDLFSPLCTNQFLPVEGNFDCGICVSPVEFNSSCSTCEVAPDEYTWRMAEVIIPDKPSIIDPPFTWRMTPEDFNAINVKRVSKCRWTSGPILVAVGPNFVGKIFNHYVEKNLSISNGSSLLVAATMNYGTLPNYDNPRFGNTAFQDRFFPLPANGVCYPKLVNAPPVSIMGAPLITPTHLTCEPV